MPRRSLSESGYYHVVVRSAGKVALFEDDADRRCYLRLLKEAREKTGARIMSLQDPTKKMSKSDENTAGFITMLDTPAEIMKKFKRAVTDSEARVYYGENKAGINNLMGIYSCITGKSYDEIEKEFEGRGYGDFKTAVGEAVVKELEPIQARYNELIKDKAYLEKCYSEAAPRAEAIARRTLQKVMKKVGYLPVAH